MSEDYQAPVAIKASKSAVEKFAEELAEKIKFSAGADIEELVKNSGVSDVSAYGSR